MHFRALDFRAFAMGSTQKEAEKCGRDLGKEHQVSLEKGRGVAAVCFASSSEFLHNV